MSLAYPVTPGQGQCQLGRDAPREGPGSAESTSSLLSDGHFILLIFFQFSTFYILIFWPSHAACGTLVPRSGIKPVPPAVGARSPNHWTTREFPLFTYFYDGHFNPLFLD